MTTPREEPEWPPRGFYGAYAVMTGFVLGAPGALTSLLFNVIGSAIVNQNPLHLIQVYLTFPLGEPALHMESGLALAVGCCLYLLTGHVLRHSVPAHPLALVRGRRPWRFALRVVTILALVLWLVNFYGLIIWLQPLLIGGNWIVDSIPWWVAAVDASRLRLDHARRATVGRFVSARPASMENS